MSTLLLLLLLMLLLTLATAFRVNSTKVMKLKELKPKLPTPPYKCKLQRWSQQQRCLADLDKLGVFDEEVILSFQSSHQGRDSSVCDYMITTIYRKRCVPWGGWLVISMNFPFLVEAKTSSCCISICLFQSSTSALNWSNTSSSIASFSDILQCNVNFGLVSRQRCRSIHRHSFTAKQGGQL